MTAPNVHPDDIRRGLVEAGGRLGEADRDRREAIIDIADWLRRAKGAGLIGGNPGQIELSELARHAGITRKTAYRLLDTDEA